jgi:hypothetical protein
VCRTLKNWYYNFVARSQEASPVIDLVLQAVIDILKLGNTSLKLGGDGED